MSLGTGAAAMPRRIKQRRPLWQRVIGILCLVIAVFLSAGVVFAVVKYRTLNSDITRITTPKQDILHGKNAPVRKVSGAQNWLVMGSDTRQGKGNSNYGSEVTGARSDTTILVHLSRGATSATLVSIPRDSYVEIPKCKNANGPGNIGPEMNKFNASFDFGGAPCTVKTVEKLTHIPIDHFVVIDFEGFKKIVNALGGINVCLSQPIDDPVRTDPLTGGKIGSGLIAPAGENHFDGRKALAFVRSRYAVGDGSDLDRIKDQQTFLSALIRQVFSAHLLFDPPKLLGVLTSVVKSLSVDQGLGLSKLLYFAKDVHDLPPSKVNLLTVPLLDGGDSTADIGGYQESVVEWDPTLSNELWSALLNDEPLPGTVTAKHHNHMKKTPTLTVPPDDITVNVLNATSNSSVGQKVATALEAQGFQIGQITDAPSQSATTYVQYGPTKMQSSQTLAASVDGGVKTKADSSLTDSINLVVGSDYSSVNAVTIGPATSPSPTQTLGIQNAQTDKCALG